MSVTDHMEATNQLLVFALGDELFGADILRVKEIRAIGSIRHIPEMPDYFLGVLDYRNVIVPVLDLRKQLGFANSEVTEQTVMIIVNLQQGETDVPVGIVVDRVSDVVDFTEQALQAMPTVDQKQQSKLLMGMFKHQSALLVVLNLDGLLDGTHLENIQDMLAEPA